MDEIDHKIPDDSFSLNPIKIFALKSIFHSQIFHYSLTLHKVKIFQLR